MYVYPLLTPQTAVEASRRAGDCLIRLLCEVWTREVYMALSPELNLPHPDMLVAANAIFEGMIIVDISQRIIFLNPAAERLSGWSIEEARGRQSQEIFKIGNALDHQRTWDPVSQALRTNTFYTLLPSSTLITRDGSEIPIEDSVSPIRNKQGAVTGAVIPV